MNLARLRQILDAYGADPRRWPEAERDAAQALAERSAEARGLIEAARSVDALLAAHPPVPAPSVDPAALAERVMATPQPRGFKQDSAANGNGWRISFGWKNVTGLAAAGIVGFMVGWSGIVGPNVSSGDDAGAADLFQFEDSPW